MEQTLKTLQTINGRLRSIENRLESIENRVLSIDDENSRCRTSADGKRSCYTLVRQNRTWSEARTHCQSICLAHGADIVSIESSAEQMFLTDMIHDQGEYAIINKGTCVTARDPFTSILHAVFVLNEEGELKAGPSTAATQTQFHVILVVRLGTVQAKQRPTDSPRPY
ncbi:hypothetical protein LSAT2_005084 [Lamellibrachia satsuma]|nr:hypothetical protein LSAT2_005084 [Lamellibrachia satsuma]